MFSGPPQTPILTGPTDLVDGKGPSRWTCVSIGGYPAPTMTMRIENTQFTTAFTSSSSYIHETKTYTRNYTLKWEPTLSNNGQTLYCDVLHPSTLGNTPQTVSLQLTLKGK